MSVPSRPPPPIVGKVTHHSIELYWDEALTQVNKSMSKGDGRTRVCTQEEEKNGGWGNVYCGYAKKHVLNGLEPWTQYKYRIRFMNGHGNSDWSPSITVSTTKEPLSGEHLHRAIQLQDQIALEKVLESGYLQSDVQVNTPDKYGFSPLMQASQRGYIDMVDTLVRHGAEVNLQNDAGKTSLMLASYSGRTAVVKELRHHGAEYSTRDRGGSTSLHWAIDGGNIELIEWMVDDGADLEATDYNGWTPLLRVAAVTGRREVGSLLLRLGANIHAKDKSGKNTLMIAVVNGHQPLVELLLENNADLSTKNEYGKTAYDMALSMERRRVIKTLEDHMAQVGIGF